MKTRIECEKILGPSLVEDVKEKLIAKGINEETSERVLDYLALHKQAFPYIDICMIAKNLTDNICESIKFNNLKESLRGLFKNKVYGYSTGKKVVVNAKPIKFILPSKKYNVMLDALIRHELDHVATTQYMQFSKDEYVKHLEKNIILRKDLFDEDVFKTYQEKDSFIKQSAKIRFLACKIVDGHKIKLERNSIIKQKSGVSGSIYKSEIENILGSTAFNEGITAYKMKKMDKCAGQGGVMCQSGYIIGEEIAKHFAKIIGEEEFIKLQIDGNFVGIIEEYKSKTGISGCQLKSMFEKMGKVKYKTAFHKLFAQVYYGLKNEMDKNTQLKLNDLLNNGADEHENN